MQLLKEYRLLQARHAAELIEWSRNPVNARTVADNIGADRTVAEYLREYSHRFAIAAALAHDIEYPRAGEMSRENEPFAPLEELFG